MPLTAKKYFQFGARRLQIAKRNSDGYPVGMVADPANITANTTMNAYVIDGLRSFEGPTREVGKVTNRGDSKIRGTAYTGVKDYGEGTFELGDEDEQLMAYLTRSALDTTVSSRLLIRAGNESQVDPEPMFIMATTRCQDEDGTKWYKNEIYYNVQINQAKKPPINQGDGENPSPLQFTFVPSLSDRGITGHMLADTTLDVLEDEDTHCVIRSYNPLTWTTWKANGSATTFNLQFKPLTNDATGAADNVVTLNGATEAVTSITVATKAVVIADAGDTGDMWVVFHETNFKL